MNHHILVKNQIMSCRSILTLLFTCWAAITHANNEITTDQAIWAFADTHGANGEFEKLLKQVNLVDKQLNWIGGKAHLVSTGDVLDRGPHPRKILDLMMKLEKQAERAGGKFHLVLGNHEIMILIGDLRYVSNAEYLEFAADETPVTRSRYFEQYLLYHQPRRPIDSTEPITTLEPQQARLQFDQEYPAGFFARYEAFLPTGKYGQWLLQKNVVLKINDSIFLHGGLSPVLMGKDLPGLNQQLKLELNNYLNEWHRLINNSQLPVASIFRQRHKLVKNLTAEEVENFSTHFNSLLFTYQSPTWYRGATYCHPYYEQDSIDKLLLQFNAKRTFVGHTVTNSSLIEQRLTGRVFEMDTGMLKMVYEGQGNILRIQNNQVDAFTSDGQVYKARNVAHKAIEYPDNISKPALKAMLESGEIANTEKLNLGTTEILRLTFHLPDADVQALFKSTATHSNLPRINNKEKSDDLNTGFKLDIAAYKLSEMLGFHMVPMAVERDVNGTKGLVQYWPEDSYSEHSANENGTRYRGYCSYDAQKNLMRIFDLLIDNSDRTPVNILVEANQEQLVWIGHSSTFSERSRLSESSDITGIHLTPQVYKALTDLTAEQLEETLGDLLGREQISALLKRRDYILEFDPQ